MGLEMTSIKKVEHFSNFMERFKNEEKLIAGIIFSIVIILLLIFFAKYPLKKDEAEIPPPSKLFPSAPFIPGKEKKAPVKSSSELSPFGEKQESVFSPFEETEEKEQTTEPRPLPF